MSEDRLHHNLLKIYGGKQFSNYQSLRISSVEIGKPRQVYLSFVIGNNQGILIVKIFGSPDGKILHVCEFFLKDDESEIAMNLNFVDKLIEKIEKAWYSDAFDDFGLQLNLKFLFITGGETLPKRGQ